MHLPLLLALLSSDPTPPMRLAVYHAPDASLDARHQQLFFGQLLRELGKLEGVTAVSASTEAAPPAEGCHEDRSCLARLATAVGGDVVILAKTTRLGETKALSLKRLDMKTGEITGMVSRTMSGGEGEELLLIMGSAVAELFPDRPLASGQSRGVPEAVAARWTPDPLPPPVFYAGLGATAVAAATGVLFGLEVKNAQRDYQRFTDTATSSGQVIDGAALRRQEEHLHSTARNANIALASTVVLAVASGVIYAFTDWDAEADVELGLVSPAP